MQVVNTAASGNSTILPGLFGTQNQGAGGLFGLLMSLFGQSGQTGLTGQLGQQNLPSLLQSEASTLLNLPSSGTGSAQTTANLTPAALLELAQQTSAADGTNDTNLLAWLKSLSTSGTVSADLNALLAGDQIDLTTFQQRLAALSDSQRDAVIGEIAALLQPVVAQQAMTPTQASDPDALSLDTPKNTSTLPPAPPTSADDTTLAAQTSRSDASLSNAQDSKAQATAAAAQNTAQASLTAEKAHIRNGKIRLDGASLTKTTDITREITAQINTPRVDAEVQVEQKVTRTTKADISRTEAATSSGTAGAASVSPAQQQATPTPTTTSKPTGEHQATQAIKAAGDATSGDSSTAGNLSDFKANTQTPTHAALAADKNAAVTESFSSHLDNVKLNRTGAHVPVAEQISVQLGKAVSEGRDRFTVKLSPAELGRIEIKIDMSREGHVTASFQVDQPATLDLLQRDQRGLERVLSDAGLKTDGSSINFNLRGDGNSQQQGGQQANANSNGNGGNSSPGFNLDGTLTDDDQPIAGVMELSWYVGPDRVDVRI